MFEHCCQTGNLQIWTLRHRVQRKVGHGKTRASIDKCSYSWNDPSLITLQPTVAIHESCMFLISEQAFGNGMVWGYVVWRSVIIAQKTAWIFVHNFKHIGTLHNLCRCEKRRWRCVSNDVFEGDHIGWRCVWGIWTKTTIGWQWQIRWGCNKVFFIYIWCFLSEKKVCFTYMCWFSILFLFFLSNAICFLF